MLSSVILLGIAYGVGYAHAKGLIGFKIKGKEKPAEFAA